MSTDILKRHIDSVCNKISSKDSDKPKKKAKTQNKNYLGMNF